MRVCNCAGMKPSVVQNRENIAQVTGDGGDITDSWSWGREVGRCGDGSAC